MRFTRWEYIGTLGLMECQKCVLYVIGKRWFSGFRCTAWKESNLWKIREKHVICSLRRHHFLLIDFMCLGRYIFHNKYFLWWSALVNKDRLCQKYALDTHNKRIWLWALISTKETTHVFTHKTRLPLHFPKNNSFFLLHYVGRELSCLSRYSFVDIFSKETRIAASMNEASSMPKGMKWSVVCVFKVFLTLYPRPAVRSR